MVKKHLKTIVTILFVVCLSTLTKGQQEVNWKNSLTGNLIVDSHTASKILVTAKNPQLNLQPSQKKSRWLAGAMSLVLPGSGEFYAGSYLKAAIFFVVEAAAITTALIYNHKGDTQTNFFQDYANKHWSASRYAYWTAQHISTLAPGMTEADIQKFQSAFPDVNSPVNWSTLNEMERAIGNDPNAEGYTHQLPQKGEQQYYELIGKYPQYSHGWDTSNLSESDYHILTPQFSWYSHQRGLANEYYQTGSTAVVFIYVNHFLSTLDAVWSVDRYNRSIAMNLRVYPQRLADKIIYTPSVNFSLNF